MLNKNDAEGICRKLNSVLVSSNLDKAEVLYVIGCFVVNVVASILSTVKKKVPVAMVLLGWTDTVHKELHGLLDKFSEDKEGKHCVTMNVEAEA